MRTRPIVRSRFLAQCLLLVALVLHAFALLAADVTDLSQDAAITNSIELDRIESDDPEFVEERDLAAARYITACAGCHSLGGPMRSGPDLLHVADWPTDQLKVAIKRMEAMVGPLTEDDLNMLSDLLQQDDLRERLKAEETRIQALFMAQMEPPDAATGRRLFFGRDSLVNGGLSCVACHAVEGRGGNLGSDLTAAFSTLGELPLISAIETAGFPLMEPHYRRHPITKQEAMHITRYLGTLDPEAAQPPRAAFVPLGAGIALALFVGLVWHLRRARSGRDESKLKRRRS
jgi:mono/diheme cytochrome c family protein